MAPHVSSDFISKEPCPSCGSRDNLARYSDGHVYCFGCEYYEHGEGMEETQEQIVEQGKDLIPEGLVSTLEKRAITFETCAHFGYTVSELGGQKVQVANYRVGGVIVAQKVRFKNKDFRFLGNTKAPHLLFGQHLWRDGGKRVVVTEGEIDALSVSQVQGNKWPVVSVPTGAKGAKKALAKELPWLLTYDEVILFFDNDEPGQEAAQECAMLFPPGRAKIAKLHSKYKDANEALVAGDTQAIMEAIFGAKTFRPDGILTIADVRAAALADPEQGFPWFLENLNKVTYGRRLCETYAFGAGTGIGKSDLFAQQIQFDITVLQQPVAVFMLEQGPAETVKRVAGKMAGKTFHVPDGSWTKEELVDAIDDLERGGKFFLYDSFGATEWDVIKATIRHLAVSEGVKLFYLDHLTALAASEDDERTALERIMAEMAGLAKELGIIIHFISHLATPDGTPHEEGGRVTIRQFRGSRAIGYWSHFMFGLERNQQDSNEKLRKITTFRVLKDRYTGRATGMTIFLDYDQARGKLVELDHNPYEEDNDMTTDESEGDF